MSGERQRAVYPDGHVLLCAIVCEGLGVLIEECDELTGVVGGGACRCSPQRDGLRSERDPGNGL